MPPLDRVDTWLYHLGNVSAAGADAIAATNADLVITEWASYANGEQPYTPARINRMRGLDQDRLIVSYLSIGEAEDYRYYWRPDWQDDRPGWLGPENPEWQGNLKVRYWQDDWQALILAYLDRIIDAGFNGVYLDIIDAFWFWEETAPRSGIDYRAEMAGFVARIRAHALDRIAETDPGRDFVIIGQNGLDLLRDPSYRAAIDGIGVEDLRFYYRNGAPAEFATTPAADYRATLDLIRLAERTDNQAFVIEYVPPGRTAGVADLLAEEAQLLGRMGAPVYVSPTRTLGGVVAQPDSLGLGPLPVLGPQTPSAGADYLRGGTGADRIAGLRGADRIEGRGGRDHLWGGSGRDTILGGTGDDRLHGGRGADRITGGRGDDRVIPGGGADRLIFRAGDGADTVIGFDPATDRIDLPDPARARLANREDGLWIGYGPDRGLLLVGLERGGFDTDSLI
jgi:cysteinyl-tRNA synthetase